jgi:D-arabinose 1-dehydrogenase-like Zn-dependent alcohol dehydrogenase
MPKMRAVQVERANGALELVERDVPEPGSGWVRIKVEACGICHSDSFTKEGSFPGVQYPRVPGHEIAGVIDAVGASVAGWNAGQRVGVGWPSGTSIDSQETLSFSALTGVRSMNEVFPLERAADAYERLMRGQARFRVVLTTQK